MKNLIANLESPSFSFKDIYKVHRMMLIGGCGFFIVGLLLIFGSARLWTGYLSLNSVVQQVQSSSLMGELNANEDGVPLSSAMLPEFMDLVKMVAENESLSKSILFGPENERVAFISSFESYKNNSNLKNSAKEIRFFQLAVKEANLKLSKFTNKYISSKKLSSTSSSSQAFLNATQDLVGLLNVPSGMEGALRIEHAVSAMILNVRNLGEFQSVVDVNSLYSDVIDIQKTITPRIESLKKIQVSSKEWIAINDSLGSIRNQTGVLGSSLLKMKSTIYSISLLGIFLLVVAGGLLIGSIVSAMKDFNSRYFRSSGNFRKNEKLISSILDSVSKLESSRSLNLELSTIEHTNLNLIVQKVNAIFSDINLNFQNILSIKGVLAVQSNSSLDAIKKDYLSLAATGGKHSEVAGLMLALVESSRGQIANLNSLGYGAQINFEHTQCGLRSLTDANESIDTLSESVNFGGKKIKRLGERTQELSKALDLLLGFSEKINILAINAALEADRAGEHGRGFSIIASEIKELSERTEKVVLEIQQSAGGIQSDARESASSMEVAANKVLQIAQFVDVALASFVVVKSFSDVVGSSTKELLKDAKENLNLSTDAQEKMDSLIQSNEFMCNQLNLVSDEMKCYMDQIKMLHIVFANQEREA